jgi:hypothetical protein
MDHVCGFHRMEAPIADDTRPDDHSHSSVATLTDPPPPASEYEMLRAALSARDHEVAMLCARLQQNNEALATVVEQLERTVSASIDRFVRRLDRLENRQNCGRGEGGREERGSSREKGKRCRYDR